MTDLDELDLLFIRCAETTGSEFFAARMKFEAKAIETAPAMIAELRSLRHEVDAAAESRYSLQNYIGQANEELQKLRAENEALRKDAERYAELREWYDLDGSVGGLSQIIERHDAAIAEEKK